jgi:hypothetical protein
MTDDTIVTAPDRVAVTVAAIEGGLVPGIRFRLPPPLGTVEVWLGYETAVKIATDLTEMLTLNDEQRANMLEQLLAQGDER